MKSKNVIFLLLTAFLFTQTITIASAEQSSFSLSPAITTLEITPGEKKTVNLTIKNFSSTAKTITFTLREFKASDKDNGQIQYVPENKEFTEFKKQIAILVDNQKIDRMIVSPNQEKSFLVEVEALSSNSPGDHYFSIIALEQGSQEKAQQKTALSNVRVGIASNIIVSIPDNNRADGNIELFSIPQFVEGGPVPIALRIHNADNNYIKPIGTITIHNMFGQLVGKLPLQTSTVLANSRRFLVAKNNPSKQTSDTLVTLWPESFLVGAYTATITIALSDKGPEFSRTITFFAFPYRLFLIFVCITTALLLIKKRLKRYTG